MADKADSSVRHEVAVAIGEVAELFGSVFSQLNNAKNGDRITAIIEVSKCTVVFLGILREQLARKKGKGMRTGIEYIVYQVHYFHEECIAQLLNAEDVTASRAILEKFKTRENALKGYIEKVTTTPSEMMRIDVTVKMIDRAHDLIAT